jgi:mono/diheme cytochrome c family protein
LISLYSEGGIMVFRTVLIALGLSLAFSSAPCLAADPSGYGQGGGEFDIKISRVPSADLAAAKALKSPFEPTPEILAEGKAIFLGRGTCFQCHGPEGKGDGGAAKVLPIQPRNFTNPKFKKYRTPGEMMWVLKNGSLGQSGKVPGTGMLPIVGQFLSEEDGWKVLLYELSLGEDVAR